MKKLNYSTVSRRLGYAIQILNRAEKNLKYKSPSLTKLELGHAKGWLKKVMKG